jgi:flagellar biosynthesis component FlhA
MEATLMKLAGIISTAALSLLLATAAAPLYAQEQHEEQKDQQEQKDKPAKAEEKKSQEAKTAKPEEKTSEQEKNTKQEEKTTQQHEQQAKIGQQSQHGRIPDDKFRANFGREHTFRVSQADYRNHRFQYGGYSFGFVGVWPSNWLYTQDVFVIDIGGVYYLCNPVYPGVNLALSFTL